MILKSIIDEFRVFQPLHFFDNYGTSVWLFSHKKNQSSVKYLLDILSRDEEKRADTISHLDRKIAYITGHALLRLLLSYLAETDITPDTWQFQRNKYGKPSLLLCPGLPEYKFNLSYTGDIVVIAISGKYETGVDIERIAPILEERIPWHVLSSKEIQTLLNIQPKERYVNFLKMWTLKEAFAKAVGMGFSLDSPYRIPNFPVSVQHNYITINDNRYSLGIASIKNTVIHNKQLKADWQTSSAFIHPSTTAGLNFVT